MKTQSHVFSLYQCTSNNFSKRHRGYKHRHVKIHITLKPTRWDRALNNGYHIMLYERYKNYKHSEIYRRNKLIRVRD